MNLVHHRTPCNTHSHLDLQFSITSSSTSMFLGGGRKLENLQESHIVTGRTHKIPHRTWDQDRTKDHGSLRW